jgi:hypothetical protein
MIDTWAGARHRSAPADRRGILQAAAGYLATGKARQPEPGETDMPKGSNRPPAAGGRRAPDERAARPAPDAERGQLRRRGAHVELVIATETPVRCPATCSACDRRYYYEILDCSPGRSTFARSSGQLPAARRAQPLVARTTSSARSRRALRRRPGRRHRALSASPMPRARRGRRRRRHAAQGPAPATAASRRCSSAWKGTFPSTASRNGRSAKRPSSPLLPIRTQGFGRKSKRLSLHHQRRSPRNAAGSRKARRWCGTRSPTRRRNAARRRPRRDGQRLKPARSAGSPARPRWRSSRPPARSATPSSPAPRS